MRFISLLLVLQFFSFTANAQEEIASDRPAFTWSSGTLKPNQAQIQSGINLFKNNATTTSNNSPISFLNLETFVRIGLPKKFELDLAYSQFRQNDLELNNGLFSSCFRYQLTNNQKLKPQSTLIYRFDYYPITKLLPASFSHQLHYSASWMLSEKFGFATANSFELNSIKWIGTTLNLNYTLSPKWGIVGEAFLQPSKSVFYNAALTYKPKPNFMFDIFCGPQYIGNKLSAVAYQAGISWLIDKNSTSKH